jgi:hypothetical protein
MRRKAFLKGVKLRAGCDEPCRLLVELRGTPRSVRLKNELTLGTRSRGLGSGMRRITVKPKRKLLRRARRRFNVQLRVTATDAAGNASRRTRTIRVRR